MLSRDELMTITPDDILKSSVFAEDREPEDDDADRRRLDTEGARWLGRSSSASSATRRPARRRSRRGIGACSARRTSRTSASTTTTATTAGSAPSGTSRRSTRTATTWTSWRSTSRHMRAGEPFLKPVYQHKDGTFGPLVRDRAEPVLGRRRPARLLHRRSCASSSTCGCYLAPPEELRRKWKVQRDCSRRGYTTDQVLAELDRREPDSEAFIRPQQQHADIVVSFLPELERRPGASRRGARRSARPCAHPDFRSVLDGEADAKGGIELAEADGEITLRIPGRLDRDRAERSRR